MIFNKKAISPVVATALLLVVAVVAVVGFQTWFTTYQSSQLVKVEQDSEGSVTLSIERLEVDSNGFSKVYVKNTGTASVNITTLEVKTSDGTCGYDEGTNVGANSAQTYNNDTQNLCALTDGDIANVIAQTSEGIVAVEMVVR